MSTPSRKGMIEFLSGHFRYHTMNSWNQATSYAANVKLHRIKFPNKQVRDAAYELLDCPGSMDPINDLIEEFDRIHNWEYQVGFNGRSGGYIVLYQGGRKLSEYKSYCTKCGQKNLNEATETDKSCGKCGADSRVNHTFYTIYTRPGLGLDVDADFDDWDTDELFERYKLVKEFDKLVADCTRIFIELAKNYRVVEKQIMVPKIIKVLEER